MQEGALQRDRVASFSEKKERAIGRNRVARCSDKEKKMENANKNMSKVSFFN